MLSADKRTSLVGRNVIDKGESCITLTQEHCRDLPSSGAGSDPPRPGVSLINILCAYYAGQNKLACFQTPN